MLKKIKSFDYFVIGGGSGGLASAKRASTLGKKVGLADFVNPSYQGTKWGLGGTCVNVGCIPKKILHQAAILGKSKMEQQKLGWEISDSPFKWETAISNINKYIKSLNFGQRSQLMKKEIEYFNAYASFENSHTIKLVNKNNEESFIEADKILIATGGRPKFLNVPGSQEYCISSDDIFWMKQNPKKTLIIGAGYIALETAGFLKAFGNEVDVLYRSKVLRQFDKDAQKIKNFMHDEGVQFLKGDPLRFTKKDGKIQAAIKLKENDSEIINEYDTVMMAVGRDPCTRNLNLEKIGVSLDEKNKIIVNEKWQTSINNIHALGDIINTGYELTPVAIQEGLNLSEGLFNNNWKKINYQAVPTTLFTPLEYSFCGLSEEEAIQTFGNDNLDVYHTHFNPLENAISKQMGENTCYTKVIVDKNSRVVQGIHYFGPNAGEVMQGFSLAIHLQCKYEDLNAVIGIHPTTAEEIVSLQFTKKENPEAFKESC